MASCTIPKIHALPLDVRRIFALVSGRKQGRVKRRASERTRETKERGSEKESERSGASQTSQSVLQARRDRWFARSLVPGDRPRSRARRPTRGRHLRPEAQTRSRRVRAGVPRVRAHTHARTHARDGVHEEEAGREEPEDAPRTGLAAGQQGMLRLQPARADLRQHDDRLFRLHLLLWYAVSSSGSKLFACSSSPLPRRPSPWQFPGSRVNRSVICHSRAPPAT